MAADKYNAPMMTGNDLRRRFLDYFAKNGHTVVPSSSLVPGQDPTLLFTNAGMVQFKGVFLGEERRDYVRAATAQKCVRAGGKHNDLENVGRTARHHTFFEMLGNFSFGDYFKPDAVAFCWELLTRDLGLPPARLTATVFTDDDGAAYVLCSSLSGRSNTYIIPLRAADFLEALPATKIFGGAGREGNAMFKVGGRYYVCSSDLHGWNASHTYCISATNILGPYAAEVVMGNTDLDFSHVTQTGLFVTVKGTAEDTVVFGGDRWSDFAGNGVGYNQCATAFRMPNKESRLFDHG